MTLSSIKKKERTISKGELSTHVCSLEWARKLKEVGVPQKSLFYWSGYLDVSNNEDKDMIVTFSNEQLSKDKVSAFLSSELGEMLPENCLSGRVTKKGFNCYWVGRIALGEIKHYNSFQSENEANARASMLVYLIENKLLPIPGRE